MVTLTTYVKAIGTKSEIFDEQRHPESRLIIWEMSRLRFEKDHFKQKLIRLSSCDEVCIDNYISSLQKYIPEFSDKKTIFQPIQNIQVSKDYLKIENQTFDLSPEALDNLRKSIAESILFLERQSRDFSS